MKILKDIYNLLIIYYNRRKYLFAWHVVYSCIKYNYTEYDTYLGYLGITDLYVFYKKDRYIINITLSRPGEFIGTHGNLYSEFKQNCIEHLGCDVEINLIEDSSWK